MASPWPPARDKELCLNANLCAAEIGADPSAFGVEENLAAELVAAAADFRPGSRRASTPPPARA